MDSDIILKKTGGRNSLNLNTSSLFAVLTVIRHLDTLVPTMELPEGLRKLLKLLFEFSEKTEVKEKADQPLATAAMKIRNVIQKSV